MTLTEALQNTNVRAFLKAIRLGEGTSDEGGYSRIVGGGTFTDFAKHPNKRVWIPAYAVFSTAAGAYQIINPTWVGLAKQNGFADFMPETQDKAAVALIKGRKALELIIAGQFFSAVAKCAPEWASLPGSKAGQRTEDMEAVKKVYIDNAGVIDEEFD